MNPLCDCAFLRADGYVPRPSGAPFSRLVLPMASICVYCSSSNAIADTYPPVAEALGRGLARRGHELVYGGGAVGLMGVLAHAAHEAGGEITGVIPSKLQDREGIAYDADELIVTETMRELNESSPWRWR